MRIVVASTHVPFIQGGATMIVEDLARCLAEAGHQTEVVSLPVWETWQELPGQLLAMRLLDLAAWSDRMVALRTPSHLLRHPDKHVWFLHHHRSAYDLWGTEYQDIPDTAEGRRTREMIHDADRKGLGEARRIFAISATTRDRLREFSGIDAGVLQAPLSAAARYRCEPAEPYLFFPSRITSAKRQVLAVDAMAHVRSGVRLVIAGPPDDDAALAAVQTAIERNGVRERVTLVSRWIPEDEKIDLMARALACVFIPFDEDSYGYVGLESCAASKPIITCSDSGGTLILVVDGETGLVAAPDAEEIAAAIDRLAGNPARAAEMGRAAHDRPDHLGVGWHHVVNAFGT